MQRTTMAVATTFACLILLVATAAAEPRGNFLGKTVDQWAGALKSDSAPDRHLAAWALAQLGAAAAEPLNSALAYEDATVRYWAVIGLGRMAAAQPPASQPVQKLAQLPALLEDKSPAVRIAAAEALVRVNQPDAAMTVLTASLADPQEAVRIQAIDSLEKLGQLSMPARREIEQATSDSSEYVKRISSRLLRSLTAAR